MNAQPLYTLTHSETIQDAPIPKGAIPSQAVLDSVVSPELKDVLVHAQDTHEKIYLLSDTLSLKPVFLHAFAQDTRLMCGIEVLSPTQFISSLWDIWGDGRARLTDTERYLAVRDVLEYIEARSKKQNEGERTSFVAQAVSSDEWDMQAARFDFSVNEGTIQTIADVLQESYQYIPRGAHQDDDVACWLIMVARIYGSYIHARGRIEDTELLDALEMCMPQDYTWGTFVFAWYKDASYTSIFERTIISWLEKHTTIHHVYACANGGAIPSYVRHAYGCAPELDAIRAYLFSEETSPHDRLTPTGALRLLHASGPYATPQIITHALTSLISTKSHTRALIACQDPQDMWHKLAPKLAYANMRVHGSMRYTLSEIPNIQLFFGFAREIVRLICLGDTWSESHSDEEGHSYICLDDMSWWPPVAIIDFLTCDICKMSIAAVYKLDEQWRQNRLLTPQAVLCDLLNPSKVSRTVTKIVRALTTKNISSVLYHLLDAYVDGATQGDTRDFYINAQNEKVYIHHQYEDALSHEVNVRAYTTLKKLCDEVVQYETPLRSSRAPASSLRTSDRMLTILDDIETLETLCAHKTFDVCVCLDPVRDVQTVGDGAREEEDACSRTSTDEVSSVIPDVYIMGMHASARQLPQSFDVVVIGDATSTQSPITPSDTLVSRLLEKLGIVTRTPKTNPAYLEFMQVLSCATSQIIVQRELSDTDMKPCYPSVMLSELMSLYGISDDTGTHDTQEAKSCLTRIRTTLDEQDMLACMDPMSCAHTQPSHTTPFVEHVSYVGNLQDDVRFLVSLPPQGAKAHTKKGAELFLSASQLEAYLRCPYEWFYGRRINLNEADAKFSPLERGSFVHKVLEDTHRAFFVQACAQNSLEEGVTAEPSYAKEAEITQEHLVVLEHIFDTVWAKTLEHQYLKRPVKEQIRAQALIPHNLADKHELVRMKEDLQDFLAYEAVHLRGFAPTLFEWNFGKRDIVEYAGVHVTGSIDRVDIDRYGNVLIIDYKNKSPHNFEASYAPMSSAFAKKIQEHGLVDTLELPHYIQTLLYAQVIRKAFPQLNVVGALYVATKKPYALSGAVKEGFEDRIWGNSLSRVCTTRMCIPDTLSFAEVEACGFEGLLDATEEAIARSIEPLARGEIAPLDTSDAHIQTCFACACAFQEKRSFAHER